MNVFSFLALALAALFTLLAFGVVLFMFSATIIGSAMGAPFVRSKKEKIARMVAYVKITAEDSVVDFGSGDGSLVIAAATAGAHAVGVEMNPLLVWYARTRIRRAGLSGRAEIVLGNFYSFPLDTTNILFLYLLPNTVASLREKMERELLPGSRVVSNAFPIPEWTPTQQAEGIFFYQR